MNSYKYTDIQQTDLLLRQQCSLVTCGQSVMRGERVATSLLPGTGDIHSPVGGKVSYVDAYRMTIVAENDTLVASVNLDGLSRDDLRKKLVELGGDLPDVDTASTVIINGVDADADVLTRQYMLTSSLETLERGLATVTVLYIPGKTVLATLSGVQVSLPGVVHSTIIDQYPAGLDPMVAKAVTGSESPEGTVVIGLDTLYHLGRIMETGLPVLDTMLSVNGRVQTVPLGVPVGELLRREGDHLLNQDRIILGGIMRGAAAVMPSQGVDRSDSAVSIIRNPDPVALDAACVGCGECVRRCPARLDPAMLTNYAEFGMYDKAAEEHIDACFECGLCGYFCIARRPMLQYIRLAKNELAALQRQTREVFAS